MWSKCPETKVSVLIVPTDGDEAAAQKYRGLRSALIYEQLSGPNSPEIMNRNFSQKAMHQA
jgi:hypothetical protein